MTEGVAFDPAHPWDDCGKKDPDAHSARLRTYHMGLWSGRPLRGEESRALRLKPWETGLLDTELGPFFDRDECLYLKSDRALPSWWSWDATADLRRDAALESRIHTANPVLDNMGGIIMWPGRRISGGQSLNQARGFSQKWRIADRLDLTVECIRLAYEDRFESDVNPLGRALERYWSFFKLFGDFQGYIQFWLLEDLLDDSQERVHFFLEDVNHYDFTSGRPLPTTVAEYDRYLGNAQEFVRKRNQRMEEWWTAHRGAAPVDPSALT